MWRQSEVSAPEGHLDIVNLTGLFHLVDNRHQNIDLCLFAADLGCGDRDTILSDMHRGHRLQPHMAVDARTRIPAAIGLLRVVDLHHHLVLRGQIRGNIHRKRRVAIGMLSGLLSIHEHLSLLVDALEVQPHHLALGCNKFFAILALAAFKPAATRARSTLAGIWSRIDVPVVRQIHAHRLSVMCKRPTKVEQLPTLVPALRVSLGRHAQRHRQADQYNNASFHATKIQKKCETAKAFALFFLYISDNALVAAEKDFLVIGTGT